jgi:hypothetical protein
MHWAEIISGENNRIIVEPASDRGKVSPIEQ